MNTATPPVGTASVSGRVLCGNRRHAVRPAYHDTAATVRACYASPTTLPTLAEEAAAAAEPEPAPAPEPWVPRVDGSAGWHGGSLAEWGAWSATPEAAAVLAAEPEPAPLDNRPAAGWAEMADGTPTFVEHNTGVRSQPPSKEGYRVRFVGVHGVGPGSWTRWFYTPAPTE